MRPKKNLQEKARGLRAKGYSYTEICKVIPVSKSSISLWCRDVPISVNKQRRLKKMALAGAERGRREWAYIRRVEKRKILKCIATQARRDVGKLSKRDRFIAGVMLYAGEGDRTQERVGMANTNPQLLRFALDWLCEFLDLDRSRFVAHLYLHVGRSERRAKQFWARELNIALPQIRYVYRPVPRKSRKGKNVHQFGVCSIRIHNKMAHRQITGWVQVVLNNNKKIFAGSSSLRQGFGRQGNGSSAISSVLV